MNQLQIFNNTEFGEVRTTQIDGKVYFVATDVAKSLGYARPSNAVSQHCKGALKQGIPTNGGTQEMNVIPEGDIYRLVIRSELPGAEKFERWIFDEVIPSIRKTGGYIAGQESMTDEELLAKALLVTQKIIKEKENQIKSLETKVEVDKPKIVFADAVSVSKTTILVGELAKILKQNGIDVGQNRLFKWLRQNGYLISRKGTDYNVPTQKSMELGLFEIKETCVTHSDGHTSINKTSKVTGKGQIYFINKFKEAI